MKLRSLCALKAAVLFLVSTVAHVATAATPSATSSSPATTPPMPTHSTLSSAVFPWDQLTATPTKVGVRRAVFDGPTATVDNVHCHITTLNPGEQSGEPRLHLLDEIIIIKEGTVETFADGVKQTAPAGAVIFFAANSVTALRNIGGAPATYYVLSYITPRTPKKPSDHK